MLRFVNDMPVVVLLHLASYFDMCLLDYDDYGMYCFNVVLIASLQCEKSARTSLSPQ
jgi:hypothetical protein